MGKKIKTCIIGDTEVGKTSLIVRIIENAFNQNVVTTIGVDYKFQNKKILGEEVGV
jgi:GTPase SAR1 family protein